MHILMDLEDLLEEQIEKIVKKGDISPTELENVYKAMKTMYYAETTNAMKEYGKDDYSRDGYSSRPYYDGHGSYDGSYDGSYGRMDGRSMDGRSMDGRRGRDGDGDGRYSEDASYRRGRDAMGRYTSRDSEKDMMISKLEKMMQNASTENERQTIMQCIRKIESNN